MPEVEPAQILVIDNGTFSHTFIQRELGGDYDVQGVSSAEEASWFTYIDTAKLFLVFGSEGCKLAKRILKKRSDAKAILMSAFVPYPNTTLPEGMDFMMRPFLPGALKERVGEVLAV